MKINQAKKKERISKNSNEKKSFNERREKKIFKKYNFYFVFVPEKRFGFGSFVSFFRFFFVTFFGLYSN